MPSTSEGLRAFEKFCRSLKTEAGTPFRLEKFQKTILWDYFDGARENVVILPKKNGKTTLMAALALFHLLTRPNAECIMLASSRDQAEIILRQARMFVRQSPELQRYLRILQRTIAFTKDEGRIRVLASDVDTADGAIPTLVIVDELHRHKNLDLYGVMRDGLGPLNGQMITISTAGAVSDSPLGRIRDHAHASSGFVREGTHNYLRSSEGVVAFHEWCLDADADVDDMKVVKTANPASWHTPKALRIRQSSGSMTRYQWLRFACGIWTPAEEPVIDEATWDPLAADIGGVADGEAVWAAVRVGQQGGCSIGIAAPRGDGVAVRAEVYPYSFPGLERALQRLLDRYDVQMIYVDKRQHGIGTDVLEAAGLPLEDEPQSPVRLMEATSTFLGMISARTLVHDGDETLRKQVLMSRMKETVTGAYFEPSAETQALIAVVMATQQAAKNGYDGPDIIVAAG